MFIGNEAGNDAGNGIVNDAEDGVVTVAGNDAMDDDADCAGNGDDAAGNDLVAAANGDEARTGNDADDVEDAFPVAERAENDARVGSGFDEAAAEDAAAAGMHSEGAGWAASSSEREDGADAACDITAAHDGRVTRYGGTDAGSVGAAEYDDVIRLVKWFWYCIICSFVNLSHFNFGSLFFSGSSSHNAFSLGKESEKRRGRWSETLSPSSNI